MIGYITIGSNDLTASAVFFGTIFSALKGQRTYSLDNMIGYSFAPNAPMIIVTRPFNGEAANSGNGGMIALVAQDRAQVDDIHTLALKLGGVDEGSPGPRGRQF